MRGEGESDITSQLVAFKFGYMICGNSDGAGNGYSNVATRCRKLAFMRRG